MSIEDTLLSEVCDLCIRAMDNALETDEFERFQNLLQGDKRARAYYFDTISTYIGLDDLQSVADASPEPEQFRLLLEILAHEEQTAPGAYIPKTTEIIPKEERIQNVHREPIFQKPSKSSLFFLAASAASLLFLIVLSYFGPDRSSYDVATLTDSIRPQWSQQHGVISKGSRLFARYGDYALESGIVMIDFDNKTRMTIEGPALFRFVSRDQIALDYGKLYAMVPPEAHGFEVTTPTANIIDLGTEFGVRQAMEGNTDLHVVSGKTLLAPVGRDPSHAVLVAAGAAKRLFKAAAEAIDIPVGDRLFVRHIDSRTDRIWRGQPVDLADIVGGGNGFGTGSTDFGIDSSSGQITALGDELMRHTIETTDIPVPASPFIDRVFYPNAKGDPVQLSSNGHHYADFPKTAGLYWGRIHHGAWAEKNTQRKSRHRMCLDGITYGTEQNPSIAIHANQGITFDLNAIRRSLDGLDIVRFESRAGVSETALAHNNTPKGEKADIWVLVDGQQRFVKRGLTAGDAALEISVEIRPEDQFLSLAVTDGQDDIWYDWGLFGRPILVVERLGSGETRR